LALSPRTGRPHQYGAAREAAAARCRPLSTLSHPGHLTPLRRSALIMAQDPTSSTWTPSGIYPMQFAFFGADGELDREAMRRQIEGCIGFGVDGIAVLGLGTEVNKLS